MTVGPRFTADSGRAIVAVDDRSSSGVDGCDQAAAGSGQAMAGDSGGGEQHREEVSPADGGFMLIDVGAEA
ncbi:hypothetical protein ACLOJK_006703, partial [Asimina triloba]